jgi:excisionase family DNA binding protein
MKLYRVGEVAQMFDVHPNTIRKWVKTGILRSIKLPGSGYNRFTREEIDHLRREMKLPPLQENE